MVAAIHDVPGTQAAVEPGEGIEHEIDEPRAPRRRRPFHEHEFVRNTTSGELLSIETKGAKETRAEIDSVIVVAPGQDDADCRLTRRCRSVRWQVHSLS